MGGVRLVSINLMRSPGALAIAADKLARLGATLVLAQELPLTAPTRIGDYDLVRHSGSTRARAAVLIIKDIPYRLVEAAEDFCTVEAKLGGWNRWIEVTSVYLARDRPLEQILGRIRGGRWKAIGGDLNALSKSWCSTDGGRRDQGRYVKDSGIRGEEIMRWADVEGLACMNVNEARSTFRNTRWNSAIDAFFMGEALAEVCLGGADIVRSVCIPTDHEALGLTLVTPGVVGRQGQTNNKGRRDPKRTRWPAFLGHISKLKPGGRIDCPAELEVRASMIETRSRDAVRLSTKGSQPRRPGSKEWWNEGLEKLRRTYQRARGKARRQSESERYALAEAAARRDLLKEIKRCKRTAARKAIETMDEAAVKRWSKPRTL